MEVWTLQQITDVAFRHQLEQNPNALDGRVELQLTDGVIRVSKRQAFVNLFWWQILTEFGRPICKKHFIKNGVCTADALNGKWNAYYDEIMELSSHNAKRLKSIIWSVLQDMYRFAYSSVADHIASLDITDMAKVTHDPKISNIVKTKYKMVDDKGDIKAGYSTKDVENIISENSKQIMELLGTPGALCNERLLPFQRCGQLNRYQVPQTIYSYGIRTDINDSIITKLVLGNALDGLNNIHEFAIESLAAKKSAVYNHTAVSQSQYFGRRMHLVTSSLVRIYDGDCGSTQTVDFLVTTERKHNLIGKNIVDDNGKLVTLTADNVSDYVGKVVHMRSPMTCRYRRGICETCGGKIYNNINRKTNLGILAALHVIENVTQKILSAKHLVKTSSILYVLPPKLKDHIFSMANTSEIRWTGEFLRRNKGFTEGYWELGIPYSGFSNFNDVNLIRDEGVDERNISYIKTIYIRNGEHVEEFNMKNDKITPSLSMPMLRHIRNNYDKLVKEQGCIWIPLKGTESIPIMITTVINDNMLEYVKLVDTMFRTDVCKFRTNADALQDVSNLIYSKVDVNIAHIETVLKAFQITSPNDYRIPCVTDTNDVHFAVEKDILRYRHVGSMLAYEGLGKYLSSPDTYTVKKQKSVLDLMVGYTQE